MALDGEKVLLRTAIQAAAQAGASPKVVAAGPPATGAGQQLLISC